MAYLNIDGDACNQPGKPYNNVLAEGRLGQDFVVEALFQYCPPNQRYGTHNVTISLRKPDGKHGGGRGRTARGGDHLARHADAPLSPRGPRGHCPVTSVTGRWPVRTESATKAPVLAAPVRHTD